MEHTNTNNSIARKNTVLIILLGFIGGFIFSYMFMTRIISIDTLLTWDTKFANDFITRILQNKDLIKKGGVDVRTVVDTTYTKDSIVIRKRDVIEILADGSDPTYIYYETDDSIKESYQDTEKVQLKENIIKTVERVSLLERLLKRKPSVKIKYDTIYVNVPNINTGALKPPSFSSVPSFSGTGATQIRPRPVESALYGFTSVTTRGDSIITEFNTGNKKFNQKISYAPDTTVVRTIFRDKQIERIFRPDTVVIETKNSKSFLQSLGEYGAATGIGVIIGTLIK